MQACREESPEETKTHGCLRWKKHEVGHKKGQACAIHMQAKIHLFNDEPERALQLEMEARRCCRRVEDRKGEAILLQTITQTYFDKFNKALEALSARASDSPEHGRLMREANRKSFKAARDALGLAKRNDNRELMGTSLVQVTRCHLTNGRLDKALKSSEEAIELLHEVRHILNQPKLRAVLSVTAPKPHISAHIVT